MAGKLIINADSKGAVNAVNALKGSWTEANGKLQIFKTGLSGLVGVFGSFHGMMMKQGEWYSQLGALGEGGAQKLDVLRSSVDDMINSSQLMASLNILNKSDLDLPITQIETLGKAAVSMARATGKSADSMLDLLTNALSSGRVSALNKFGFNLSTVGDVAEKQKNVIDALAAKYQNLSIKAEDSAEKADKLKNSLEIRKMELAKNFEKPYNSLISLGNTIAKGWTNILTMQSEETRQNYKIIDSINLQKHALIAKAQTINDITRLNLQMYEMEKAGKDNLVNTTIMNERKLAVMKRQSQAIRDQMTGLKAQILGKKKLGEETWDEEIRLRRISKEYQKHIDKVKELEGKVKKVYSAKNAFLAFSLMGMDPVEQMRKWQKIAKDIEDKKKRARQKAAQEAKQERQALAKIREEYNQQLKFIERIGTLATDKDREQLAILKTKLTLNKRDRAQYQLKINLINKIRDRQAKAATERKTQSNEWLAQYKAELDADEKLKNEKLKSENEYNEKLKTWQKERWDRLQKEAIERKKLIEKVRQREISQGSGLFGIGDEIKKAKEELEAAKAKSDEVAEQRAKNRIALLEKEAQKLGQLKTKYSGFMMVGNEATNLMKTMGKKSIELALMENSELKKLGKTRKQVLKETLAGWLKTKAVEWGLKSGEEGLKAIVAAVTPGMQAAAGAHAAAAAGYAGLAMAAGYAGKQLGKGGSKGTTGKSATAQAPSSSGTESKGSNLNIYISESVIGDHDQLATTINGMIVSAKDRGVIS